MQQRTAHEAAVKRLLANGLRTDKNGNIIPDEPEPTFLAGLITDKPRRLKISRKLDGMLRHASRARAFRAESDHNLEILGVVDEVRHPDTKKDALWFGDAHRTEMSVRKSELRHLRSKAHCNVPKPPIVVQPVAQVA